MTDKERLIRRLNDWGIVEAEPLADYLLANGVKVLSMPIGSIVYEIRAKGIRRYNGRKYDYAISSRLMFKNAVLSGEELYVRGKKFTKTDNVRLNKTVFLKFEQAEKEIERWKNAR